MLRARDYADDSLDHGDPSGTKVYAQARSFKGTARSAPRAVTPEAAESSANAQYKGLFRNDIGKDSSVTFATTPATVEADKSFTKPEDKAARIQVIKPRARSAIDTPQKGPDLASGAAQMPTIAMGSTSAAQTYEGATSISASDAIFINGGGKNVRKEGFTDAAYSMITSFTKGAPRASKVGSFGVTAQTAKAASFAGTGDGRTTVAQANEVASYSQASQTPADQWQVNTGDSTRRWVGTEGQNQGQN